jgi:hypothetical protein
MPVRELLVRLADADYAALYINASLVAPVALATEGQRLNLGGQREP